VEESGEKDDVEGIGVVGRSQEGELLQGLTLVSDASQGEAGESQGEAGESQGRETSHEAVCLSLEITWCSQGFLAKGPFEYKWPREESRVSELEDLVQGLRV